MREMPFPVKKFLPPMRNLVWSLLACVLASCDQIAVLDGTKAREADAFAVGSACRQSGRALEDCYVLYPQSPKAQVFAGWKEMNDYMTSNKIDVIAPTLVKNEVKGEDKEDGGHGAEPREAKADKPAVTRAGALPPTSMAATNPLAGVPRPGADGKPADKGGAKGAEARH
jgi:hypothetical protein